MNFVFNYTGVAKFESERVKQNKDLSLVSWLVYDV
jgi:hypothetical protein